MKQFLKFSLLLVVMFGCHRDKVDYLGPAYVSAPKDFSVTNFSASPNPINFTTGPKQVEFNATFSSTVSWVLTITGAKSGAVKKFTGIGNGLSSLIWTGTHDGLAFFRQFEVANATLSFYGNTITYNIPITVVKPRSYVNYGQYPMIGDFEDPSQVEPSYGPPIHYSPYWASFNFPTAIPNVEQGVDSVAVDYNGNLVKAIEGSQYYFIRGKGNQSNFVSGLQYFGSQNIILDANADNVWVNFYLYGTGNPNATVEMEYQEMDADGTTMGYQGTDDDAFVAKVTLDHKGWKLFSFKYSSLTPSLNADFGGSGNKIHEPNRLASFDMVLVKKSIPDQAIEVYYDFPIITMGGPFDPSK